MQLSEMRGLVPALLNRCRHQNHPLFMLKSGLSILLVLLFNLCISQPVLQWAKAFTGVNPFGVDELSNGRSVAVDGQGNVYSAGFLANNVDFDPGPGVQ